MSESLRRRVRVWKSYLVCGLPFAAGMLAFLYLGVQGDSGKWGLNPTPTPTPTPTVVCPTPTPPPDVSAETRGRTVLQFGHLLCVPNGLKVKFGEVLSEQRGNYTPFDWQSAASAAGLMAWRFTTGLVVVAFVCTFAVAFAVIWRAPRRAGLMGRAILALPLLAGCAGFVRLTDHFQDMRAAVVARQFLAFIEVQLQGSSIWRTEVLLLYLGYWIVTYMFCASGATLAPYSGASRAGMSAAADDLKAGAEDLDAEAEDLAARMRSLRLLLYAGAFLLAAGVLRGKLNYEWAMSYLPPLAVFENAPQEKLAATLIYERLRAVGSNMVTSVAALNTLLLAAIYVPATLVLQRRAEKIYLASTRPAAAAVEPKAAAAKPVSKAGEIDDGLPGEIDDGLPDEGEAGAGEADAAKGKTPPSRDDWMKTHGLSFPLKDQLGRVAAILSPLLAGPLGELLSFLKG